jgi:ketosteroid isomerase-like protein
VRGGKIARIEEYLDSAQANALRAASGREPIGT